MPHLNVKDLDQDRKIPEKTKIIVVGGGVSGLYATWRIMNKKKIDEILILEQLDRTGGRLDSDVIDFGMGQEVKEEEGGMRFTFDTMDNLMALFLDLGLDKDIVPFPMQSGGNNRLYFRGKTFNNNISKKEDYAIWSELYNLEDSEKGYNPKEIITTVFNRILEVNPDFKERPENRGPEFWQKFRVECKWNGIHLYDWTMWGLLSEMGYSNECITLLYRLLGFNGTFLSTMNAGVAYQLLEDFPADPKFRTLKNGFSTLTNTLTQKIGNNKIFLKTHVDNLTKEGEEFVISFTRTMSDGTLVPGEIRAEQVILCLPRLALEKLFIRSDAFGQLGNPRAEELWSTLQSTSNQPLLKINLYYEKAWWGKKISGQAPVEFGPNFSDLPLGSVYPFYTVSNKLAAALEYAKWLRDNDKEIPEDVQKALDEKYEHPAALTIYCDYLNINFWKGLQNQSEKFYSVMQQSTPKLQPASLAIVNRATEFFKKLFNTVYVPEPVLTSARIWSGSSYFPESAHINSRGIQDENDEYQPYGFGVHQWALGAKDDDVIKELVQPLDDVEIYTCGEAYSDYQGWVEGALRSTNLVLKQGFGISPISEEYKAENGIGPDEQIKCNYMKNTVAGAHKFFKDVDPDFKVSEDCKAITHFKASAKENALADDFGLLIKYFK